MTIELDYEDRKMLVQCPFQVSVPKNARLSRWDLARMKRIKRLLAAGLIRGEVVSAELMRVTLKDAGRAAIGRPPAAGPA